MLKQLYGELVLGLKVLMSLLRWKALPLLVANTISRYLWVRCESQFPALERSDHQLLEEIGAGTHHLNSLLSGSGNL